MVKIHAPFQSVLFWLTLLVSLLALPAHSADLVASVSKNKVVKMKYFSCELSVMTKSLPMPSIFPNWSLTFLLASRVLPPRPISSMATTHNAVNGPFAAAQKVGIVTIPSFQLGSHQTSPSQSK
uniref:hypothetical protein n=1 Tax=Vibrio cholerae TaxID=666 RepID=UPI003F581403